MNSAIAVFAKTLGLSAVKTRLAAMIGAEKAETFYRLSVDCVEANLNQLQKLADGAIVPVWAVAEQDGPSLWAGRSFNAEWTGEGNLGTRLANVSERLFSDHESVLLTGTDSPQLGPERFIEAAERVKDTEKLAVVGPAADGGFYLFASSTAVPRSIWEAVTYSESSTLNELEQLLLREQWQIFHLQEEQDVDLVGDLSELRGNLSERTSDLSSSQTILLAWLEENKALF